MRILTKKLQNYTT